MNDKNIAIIDIGSNSVRERISSNGKVFFRKVITTQLAKNRQNGILDKVSICRTFEALDLLVKKATDCNAQIFAFATAAVRNASNQGEFCSEFFSRYGITLDVLSGDKEAQIGLLGALDGGDGTVIDVGGASTEIITSVGGQIVYSHSMQEGAVSLTDRCGKNFNEAKDYLSEKIKEFEGVICHKKAVAIGGTANTVAFILSNLTTYDREKTNGFILKKEVLEQKTAELYSLAAEQIEQTYRVEKLRAQVIHSGALLLLNCLNVTKCDKIILTENDNLEGYYMLKTGGK
ncbi:MAG: hypothetical protein IJW13_00280 [Clostridia bacterium]|nr:hypothetical protein [Clostridia bacterium]